MQKTHERPLRASWNDHSRLEPFTLPWYVLITAPLWWVPVTLLISLVVFLVTGREAFLIFYPIFNAFFVVPIICYYVAKNTCLGRTSLFALALTVELLLSSACSFGLFMHFETG